MMEGMQRQVQVAENSLVVQVSWLVSPQVNEQLRHAS